jgi:hypothetical protein
MGIPTLIADNSSDTTDLSEYVITSGIDSTYDEYMFVFTGINPASNTNFGVQFNADGAADYNETITDSVFYASHTEADATGFAYDTSRDLAQATGLVNLTENHADHSDEGCGGILHLFSPSSTTYVTHFYCRSSAMTNNSGAYDMFTAGYINTTAAITDVKFACASGNFDGLIQMYGIA